MQGGGAPQRRQRPIVYCLVPGDLGPKLHELLRRHFGDDPAVEVVVERRGGDRRRAERRGPAAAAVEVERRQVRAHDGRRAGERRAVQVAVLAPQLPRRARPHADRLRFVERLEPSGQRAEDADTARLVARVQSGERELFADIYMRYFDRIYTYLRVVLDDPHDAEDAAQQVFVNVLDALPRYEHRAQPFRAYLFTVARNFALTKLKRDRRLTVVDIDALPVEQLPSDPPADIDVLDWISDRELTLFVERLPLAQRQVLFLRYVGGLGTADVAAILDRPVPLVRKHHERALAFLRERLEAVGRVPERRGPRMGSQVIFRQAAVVRKRRFSLIDPG
jgi:RNA polymerase sigma-70 factor (ECF subfamily)